MEVPVQILVALVTGFFGLAFIFIRPLVEEIKKNSVAMGNLNTNVELLRTKVESIIEAIEKVERLELEHAKCQGGIASQLSRIEKLEKQFALMHGLIMEIRDDLGLRKLIKMPPQIEQ